jgi:acetone carboxylase alpha subunit
MEEKLINKLRISEEAFRETGKIYGLEELRLKNEDPIKYELLHSRLLASVISARAVAKMIASSVVTREMGEMSFAIYTPEGESVVFSTGLLIHIKIMGMFTKWLIENNYEDDPGFEEGDYFCCNDMTIAGLHLPDVYFMTPMYHDGKMIGWVGSVTHEMDVGGAWPGAAMGNQITSRFMEGLHISGEKVGANDRLRRDYEIRITKNTRVPVLWLLDDKAKIAGSVLVRQEIKKAIAEFGLDYYQEAIHEYVEEGRQIHLARVKERLVPGRYRNPIFWEIALKGKGIMGVDRDYLIQQPQTLTIEPSGHMVIDFDGASPEGVHNQNAGIGGMMGGLSIILAQMLHFDGKANDGNLMDIDLLTTLGSVCKSTGKGGTNFAWGNIEVGFAVLMKLISRGFFSRGYVEEVMAGGGTNTSGGDLGGTDQYGGVLSGTNFEIASGGSGARGVMDGIDAAWAVWNPTADQGNAEAWEQLYPYLYLGRRVKTDSGGPGRYRGGVNFQSVWMVWNSNDAMFLPYGGPSWFMFNYGLYGGYPPPAIVEIMAKNTNIKALIDSKKPLPHEPEEIAELLEGEIRDDLDTAYPVLGMKTYDIFSPTYSTGGGFGDPLDRDVALVEKDLTNGFVSPRAAKLIYGVKALFDEARKEWHADIKATKKSRLSIKKRRLKRAIPVREWWQVQRKRVQAGELPEEVNTMYAEVRALSPKWGEQFDRFWALA